MDNLDGTKLGKLKKWRCAKDKDHILGVIEWVEVSVRVNGSMLKYHTTRLLIFRKAITMRMDIPDEIEVAGVLDGRMLSMIWTCSIPGCGCVKEWHPDDDALEWLNEKYGVKEGG